MKTETEILNYLIGRAKHLNDKIDNLSKEHDWIALYGSASIAYAAYCAKFNEARTALLFMGYDVKGVRL